MPVDPQCRSDHEKPRRSQLVKRLDYRGRVPGKDKQGVVWGGTGVATRQKLDETECNRLQHPGWHFAMCFQLITDFGLLHAVSVRFGLRAPFLFLTISPPDAVEIHIVDWASRSKDFKVS